MRGEAGHLQRSAATGANEPLRRRRPPVDHRKTQRTVDDGLSMAFGNRLSPRDDDIVNAELRELNAVQLDLDFGVAHQCKARGDRQIHPTLTAKHGRRSVRRQTAPEYVAQTPAPRRDGPRSKQRFLETGEREVERKRHQQPLTVALMLSKCGETNCENDEVSRTVALATVLDTTTLTNFLASPIR